jgi:hypothetical protein
MLSRFIVSMPRYRWYFLTVMVALVPLIHLNHALQNTPFYLHNVNEYVPAYFEPYRGSHTEKPDIQFAINFMKLVFPCWIALWFGMRALEWNPQHEPFNMVMGSTLKIASILSISSGIAFLMICMLIFVPGGFISRMEVFERHNTAYYHLSFSGDDYSSEGVYICDIQQRRCSAVFSRRNSHLIIEENGYEVRILENDRVLYPYSDS